MLAQYMLLLLWVCVFVISQYCIEKAAWIELFFAYSFFWLILHCSEDIKVLPSGTFSQTLDLEDLAAIFVGLLLITPGDDGERGHVLSPLTDDRCLLITLGV